MIYGNLQTAQTYSFLEEAIQACFQYAKEHDLAEYEKGSYEIDEDRLFVNIVEYETTTEDKRFFEAHREYLDLHLMLRGEEKIGVNFIHNLEQGEYKKDEDYLAITGKVKTLVTLTEEDFLICYPEDGHMTALQVTEPRKIKKAIFKIRITQS